MNIIRKLKYLFIIPVVALVVWASSWGIADVFSYQALSYERMWVKNGAVRDQQDWDSAVVWSKLAMTFNPYNPNYPEMLGRLHFWRFFVVGNPIESYEESQLIVNEGLSHLRKAIEMRPTWPVAWASLLQLKSIGGQIDYEFEQVWDKSVELGDWEPKVQTILLEAGIIHWPVLNDVLRNKTIEMFVLMTSKPYSQNTAVVAIARLDAWPLVCDMLVDPVLMTDVMRLECGRLSNELLN